MLKVRLDPIILGAAEQNNLPTSIDQKFRKCYVSLYRPSAQGLVGKTAGRLVSSKILDAARDNCDAFIAY